MNWLSKIASDETRIAYNIERLEKLQKTVHELALFGVASQSGGFQVLEKILDNRIVLGRPKVHEKLKEALIGENNQKIALDAPTRFQKILFDAEELVRLELVKEQRLLNTLVG